MPFFGLVIQMGVGRLLLSVVAGYIFVAITTIAFFTAFVYVRFGKIDRGLEFIPSNFQLGVFLFQGFLSMGMGGYLAAKIAGHGKSAIYLGVLCVILGIGNLVSKNEESMLFKLGLTIIPMPACFLARYLWRKRNPLLHGQRSKSE